MGVKFSKIHVDDLSFVYNNIEEKLKYIIKKSYADWTPADIHAALKTKEAELYIVYKEADDVGFIITAVQENYGSGPTLFIWATYTDPKYDCKKEGFEYIEGLAKKLQADNIEFQTSRKGWAKTGPKFGYKLVSSVYRKEM